MIAPYLDSYQFDDDRQRLDYKRLEAWLSSAYWSLNIKEPEIRQGAAYSALVVGCYDEGGQVGYLRVISDRTRFAYLMDVFVDPAHRRRGIARHMVEFALKHPDLVDVYQWMLATSDAHTVYRKAGFAPLANPEKWMNLRKEKIRT